MNIHPLAMLGLVGAVGAGAYWLYQKKLHDAAMAELTKPVDTTQGNTLTASNQAIMDVIGSPSLMGYGSYEFRRR